MIPLREHGFGHGIRWSIAEMLQGQKCLNKCAGRVRQRELFSMSSTGRPHDAEPDPSPRKFTRNFGSHSGTSSSGAATSAGFVAIPLIPC